MNRESARSNGRAAGGRTALAIFILIAAAAFGVRLLYLSQLSGNPLFEHPMHDPADHHLWAQQFASGENWSVDPRTGEPAPYFRAPLYIWFLGTIYAVFGVDPGWTPRLIQSLLGALTCGLLFLLGSRAFGRTAGAAAGILAAFYWTLVYFDNELLIHPLIVFLDVLAVYLLVRAADERAWPWWAAAGLVLGLSAIARPNVLLFAAGVFLWIILLERRAGWRRVLKRCAVFGLALLLPIVPVTIRNYVAGGDLVLISSQGGVNFFIGNNPQSDGLTAMVPGTSLNWRQGHVMTADMAERALGRKARPSEVSKYFFDKGLEFWAEEPNAAVWLFAKKARYLFCRQEYANNQCIYTFTEEYTPLVRWLAPGYWLAAPLGLLGIGICLARRQCRRRLFPLWGFVALYGLSIVLFFVTARFRMPIVPFLLVFAGFAAVWLLDQIRARRLRPLLGAGPLLVALFALVLYVPDVGFAGNYRDPTSLFGNIAMEMAHRGEKVESLPYFERAEKEAIAILDSAESPPGLRQYVTWVYVSTLLFRGEILLQLDRPAEAVACWRRGLDRLPEGAVHRIDLHDRIAAGLDAMGKPAEAARHRASAQELRRLHGIAR